MAREPTSDYSETLLDHYKRPRNLGDLDDADAVAIVHDDVCGDVVRLAVRVEPATKPEERKITEARFKAYGCAAAIASGSIVTELLKGSTVEQAAAITDAAITEALGGLPPRRVHAAVLGREVVKSVLRQLARISHHPS